MSTMKLIKLISTVFIVFIGTISVENSALANQNSVEGEYDGGVIHISINPIKAGSISQSNYYTYFGMVGGKSLTIREGAKNLGTLSRQVYTWDNKGTKYQVIWKPSDPEYIRLRVFSGGREVLNKILRAPSELS
jgi:hypothetical protein